MIIVVCKVAWHTLCSGKQQRELTWFLAHCKDASLEMLHKKLFKRHV